MTTLLFLVLFLMVNYAESEPLKRKEIKFKPGDVENQEEQLPIVRGKLYHCMKSEVFFKDYIRKHAVFWSKTPEYCMFSDVILKRKLHFSCSDSGRLYRKYTHP